MILIVWVLFGALVGLAAAQWHRFRLAYGLIGGILLGPLALLMLLARRTHRLCPNCLAWLDDQATVCQRCLRDLAP